jgi:hypothetical protein
VTDFTAMPELCGAGWLVGGEPWWDPQHGAFFMPPSVEGIVGALEEAYRQRDNFELRARAREFALGYDADRVMAEHWTPVLEALTGPREVAPLPNRQLRRAAARQRVKA